MHSDYDSAQAVLEAVKVRRTVVSTGAVTQTEAESGVERVSVAGPLHGELLA